MARSFTVCASLRAGFVQLIRAGSVVTDRPHIPRLIPAREALLPVCSQATSVLHRGAELGYKVKSRDCWVRVQRVCRASEASTELRSEAEERQGSSLVEIQNNRDTGIPQSFQALGRNRNCGRWTIMGVDGLRRRFHRLNCKTWGYCYCGQRKAKRYRFLIGQLAEKEQLTRFLTLTLDPSKIEGDSVRHLRRVFNKFRLYLRRKFGQPIPYIAVLEFHKSGIAHLHVLIGCYIEQQWIKQSWSALGGGEIVDIRYVDVHRVSWYVSKYLTKELLLSAPLRSRRVTTSRSLRLLQKSLSDEKWTLFKVSIFFFFFMHSEEAVDVQLDNDGFLESFCVNTNKQ
jgi:hypothetical protein